MRGSFRGIKSRVGCLGWTLLECLLALSLLAGLSAVAIPSLQTLLHQQQLYFLTQSLLSEIRFLRRQVLYQGCAYCGIQFNPKLNPWQIEFHTPSLKHTISRQDYPHVDLSNVRLLHGWLPINHHDRTHRSARIVLRSGDWSVLIFVSVFARLRVCATPQDFWGLPRCDIKE